MRMSYTSQTGSGSFQNETHFTSKESNNYQNYDDDHQENITKFRYDQISFENQGEKQHQDFIDAHNMFTKSIENIDRKIDQILGRCQKIDDFRTKFLNKLRNDDPDVHDTIVEELEKIYDDQEFQSKGKRRNSILNEKTCDDEQLIITLSQEEEILDKVNKKMNELTRITRRRERNSLDFTTPSQFTVEESQLIDLQFEKIQENDHQNTRQYQVLTNSLNNINQDLDC